MTLGMEAVIILCIAAFSAHILAQDRRIPTISFNPYRDVNAHPGPGGARPPQTDENESESNQFNKRIGLSMGLSAFFLSAMALVGFGCYRRSLLRRRRQELRLQGPAARIGDGRPDVFAVGSHRNRAPQEMVTLGPEENQNPTQGPTPRSDSRGSDRAEASGSGTAARPARDSASLRRGSGGIEEYRDAEQGRSQPAPNP